MASSSDENDDKANEYDAELDFLSPNFNPERALKSDSILVPYPAIKSFPSLNSYKTALEKRQGNQRSGESPDLVTSQNSLEYQKIYGESSDSGKVHQSDITRNQSRIIKDSISSKKCIPAAIEKPSYSKNEDSILAFGQSSLSLKQDDVVHPTKPTKQPENNDSLTDNPSQAKKEHEFNREMAENSKGKEPFRKRNVFIRMDNVDGPLSFLRRCVRERLLVRVVTRGAVLVRGICRGYIVAFDKYFNMALIDVDEIYRRPASLGKVRARRSEKLCAAQPVLTKEREDYQKKWKEKQNCINVEVTSNSMQALNLLSSLIQPSENQPGTSKLCQDSKPENLDNLSVKIKTDSTALHTSTTSSSSLKDAPIQQKKLQRLFSVYDGVKTPFSPFEREALLLGIPDENVTIRHVNQLFVRGDNVVSVSIVDDL